MCAQVCAFSQKTEGLDLCSSSEYCFRFFKYVNFLDWGIHILLHKLKGKSRFKFHWKHHGIVRRRNNNHDPDYRLKIWHNETILTVIGITPHVPVLFVWFPFAVVAIMYGLAYAVLHRLSHTYVDFLRSGCRGTMSIIWVRIRTRTGA